MLDATPEKKTRWILNMALQAAHRFLQHSAVGLLLQGTQQRAVMVRGTKHMADMGCMSPQMASLAKNQDIIGWKNFMERGISRHFFGVQNEYLILGSHRINAKQWVRQFISKILHITHNQ